MKRGKFDFKINQIKNFASKAMYNYTFYREYYFTIKWNLSFSIHIYHCGNTLFCCARRPLAVGYCADSDAPCC